MSFDVMYKKATDLYQTGAHEQAERICRQLLCFVPENSDVLNLLGLISAAKNDHKTALIYYNDALKTAKNPLSVYFNMALSQTMLHAYIPAIQAYEEILKTAPSTKEVYNNLADIYKKIKEPQKATEAYKKVLSLDKENVTALVGLAEIQNDLDTLKNLSARFEGSALPAFHAALLLFDQKDYKGALDFALTADKRLEAFEIKNLLAQIYLKLEDKEKAVSYFHFAKVLFPQSIDALLNLAVLEENEDYFKKAASLAPDNYRIYLAYGDFLYQNGRRIEALETYHKAVLRNADDPALSNNVALVLKDLGDFKGALDLMMNAFLLAPDNIDISVNIAETLVLLYQNEPNEARKIAKLWQKNAPDNVFAGRICACFEKQPVANDTAYAETLFDQFADVYEDRMQDINYAAFDAMKGLNIDLQGQILDLGCATGTAGLRFKGQNNTFTGVDISQKMLQKADEKRLYANLIKSDILSFLKHNTQKFDCILCLDVAEYMQNFAEVITWCQKTAPKLIFTFEKAPKEVKDFLLYKTARYQHNPDFMADACTKAGYKKITKHALVLRKENGKNVDGFLFVAEI